MTTTNASGAIKLLSGNGAKGAVRALAAQFERTSGHSVELHFEVNVAIKRKVETGEPFDALVLNPPILDDLIAQGLLDPATRADIGRAGLGVGIRAGAPKPDIASAAAFRQALLTANAIAYPGEGASGVYFVSLLGRLGIADQMKPKLRPMAAEDTAEVVARGEADMVVVVASRLSDVAGVELAGLIPQELQTVIGFAAAVGKDARKPAAARALVGFFSSSAAIPTLRAMGVEPAAK